MTLKINISMILLWKNVNELSFIFKTKTPIKISFIMTMHCNMYKHKKMVQNLKFV